MCVHVEVWKRAISEGEEKLTEMKRVLSEKTSHQQRLIGELQQYIRVQENLSQRETTSAADNTTNNSNNNNNRNTELPDDDDETRQQDALSGQLSTLVNSLKALTTDSLQVCRLRQRLNESTSQSVSQK